MSRGLFEEEKGEKKRVESEYTSLLKMEEIPWRQRSRATWLKEGGQNTNFFHKMTSWRKSINQISRLKVNRNWVYDQSVIRDNIEQYFIDLYHDPMPSRPHLEGVQWATLEAPILKGLSLLKKY